MRRGGYIAWGRRLCVCVCVWVWGVSFLRDFMRTGCFLTSFLFNFRQNSASVSCICSSFLLKAGCTKQLRCSHSSLRYLRSSNYSFLSLLCLTGRQRSSSGREYSLSLSQKGQFRQVMQQPSQSAIKCANFFSLSSSKAVLSKVANLANLALKDSMELPIRSSASILISSAQYSSVCFSSSLYFSPLENISSRSSSRTLLLSSTMSMEKMPSPSSSIFCRSKKPSMPSSDSMARTERTLMPSLRRLMYSASTQGLCRSSRYIMWQALTFANSSLQRRSRPHIAYSMGLKRAACSLRESPCSARRKGAEKTGLLGSKIGSISFCFRMRVNCSSSCWLVNPSALAKRLLTNACSQCWQLKQQETSAPRGSASCAMSSFCAISMRKTGTMMLQILYLVSMSMIYAAMARARCLISPCLVKQRKKAVQSSCFITRNFSSPEWLANRFFLVSMMFQMSSPRALNSMIRSNTSSWSIRTRSQGWSSKMTAETSSTVGQQVLKKGYFILYLGELNMPAQISESSRKRRLTFCQSRMLTMASMYSLFSSQTGLMDSLFLQRQMTMFSMSLLSTLNILTRKSSCSSSLQVGMWRQSCMRMMRKHLKAKLQCSSTQRLLLRQFTSSRILQANNFSSCSSNTSCTLYRTIQLSTMRQMTSSPFSRIQRRVMSMLMLRRVGSSCLIYWMLIRDYSREVRVSGKGMFYRQETTSSSPASSLPLPTRTFSMMAFTITQKTSQLLSWKSCFSLLNLFSTIFRSAHEERLPWKNRNMLERKSCLPPATVFSYMGYTSFSRKMPFLARSSWKYISNSQSSRSRRNSPVPMNSFRMAEWKVLKETQSASQNRNLPCRCGGSRGQLASMNATSSSSYSVLNYRVSSCSQRMMKIAYEVHFSILSCRAAFDSANEP